MSIETQVKRVTEASKDTLKTLITKMGVAVGDESIDQYPALAETAVAVSEKQDKLSGAAGQVVGFDSDGAAIAQDANYAPASHVEDGVQHITTDERSAWNAKLDMRIGSPIQSDGCTLWFDTAASGYVADIEANGLDTTLTIQGKAADAKAVGDALEELSKVVNGTNGEKVEVVEWEVGNIINSDGSFDPDATTYNYRSVRLYSIQNLVEISTEKFEDAYGGVQAFLYDGSRNFITQLPVSVSSYSWNHDNFITNVINNLTDEMEYIAFDTYQLQHPTITIKRLDYETGLVPELESLKVETDESLSALSAELQSSKTETADSISALSAELQSAKDESAENIARIKPLILNSENLFRLKKHVDHMFINESTNGENIVIPNQSIFNIQTSKRLGFDVIEVNANALSDGYIAMHGSSGKFGNQVAHIDGTTDISETNFADVSKEWVKANVRYKSKYAKYQVAPLLLEEFLYECKKVNLIPLIQIADDAVRVIADQILGVGNYIAYTYGEERGNIVAPIYVYKGYTTKDEILACCRKYGTPLIYCMSNPTDFTVDELKEISDALHAEGYLIGLAGCYTGEGAIQKCFSAGFDCNSSSHGVNDFDAGNLCNLSGDTGDFSDFSYDGVLQEETIVLATGQTITPKNQLSQVFLGKGSLHINYVGSIALNFGAIKSWYTFTNDEPSNRWFSSFFLEQSPTFTIIAKSDDTKIYSITYKASKV